MSQDAEAPSPEPVRLPPFRTRYKLHGMIATVVVMWLDFAYIYSGLLSGDLGALVAGMAVMLATAGAAYYFG